MICDSIIGPPSCQGMILEAKMLSWGMQVSKMNGFSLGAITTSMTEPLFMEHGFEVVGEAVVPRDGDVEGFTQRVVLKRWRRT